MLRKQNRTKISEFAKLLSTLWKRSTEIAFHGWCFVVKFMFIFLYSFQRVGPLSLQLTHNFSVNLDAFKCEFHFQLFVPLFLKYSICCMLFLCVLIVSGKRFCLSPYLCLPKNFCLCLIFDGWCQPQCIGEATFIWIFCERFGCFDLFILYQLFVLPHAKRRGIFFSTFHIKTEATTTLN